MFHTFSRHFNTFLIVKVIIFNFSQNSLNKFKYALRRYDRPHWALKHWCTSNLHSMVASVWKIQFNICPHTIFIHSNTFLIVKVIFSIFVDIHSMNSKMAMNDKIMLIEALQLFVHQIYILYYNQFEKIYFKICPIHFNTFSIMKVFIFNFSWNSLNGLKNGLQR